MIGGIISTIGTGLTEICKIGTTIGGIITSFGLDGYDIGLSSISDFIGSPYPTGGIAEPLFPNKPTSLPDLIANSWMDGVF